MLSPIGELTAGLIARPSVTPDDAGCLDIIGDRLAAQGFRLTRLPSADVDNLWAVRGDHGPCFAFAGHTDVVPPGNPASWRSPPFEPTIEGDILRGRGAADMKGSLAAMIVAVERFIAANPDHPGQIAFLLTSDEEGPATDGTVKITEYLKQHDIKVDWCVVGEPSCDATLGDTVRVGRRGSLNGHLVVRGIQGHVAYPDRARNPIHQALAALDQLCKTSWDAGNEFYPPTSFQISNIHAGTGAENVIPERLEVQFNFRYSTAQTSAGLKHAVEQIFQRAELDHTINWRLSGEPFLTPGGRLVECVSAVIERALGIVPELSTGGGTSDGRFIAPMGIELVELGPRNATIHKIDEAVSLSELDQLGEVYQQLLEGMLLGAD